jgi:UDP-N-acetylmuramate--alanine ligase
MPGRHNVQNALAAIAVALELGHGRRGDHRGFERFEGVKRRFTRVGEVDGAIVIDDYAHHPSRSAPCCPPLARAREGRVIAVMQPHRYSRLQALMDEFQNAFNDADIVLCRAGLRGRRGADRGRDAAALVEGLRSRGHRMVRAVDGLERPLPQPSRPCREGDMIICMGAGDITKWAAAIADGVCAARAKKSPLGLAGGIKGWAWSAQTHPPAPPASGRGRLPSGAS